MKEKQIRLELILQILDMAANHSVEIDLNIIAPEKNFSKWVNTVVKKQRNNILQKTGFDETLYNQVNSFLLIILISFNYLFQVKLHQVCH